jgi:hypothetical protein
MRTRFVPVLLVSETVTQQTFERGRRLRFDLPDHEPERFLIIYRLRPDDTPPADTVEVISIGPRGGHAANEAAVARLADT